MNILRRGRAEISDEGEAWRFLPAATRRNYGEDFVAVHNREVVDHDTDRLTLHRRNRPRFSDVPVLITPANSPSPREFQLLSPAWNDPHEHGFSPQRKISPADSGAVGWLARAG